MAKIKLSPILTSITGSIAGGTFQKSVGGLILRSKPIRRNPVSNKLQVIKAYMAQVIAAWQNLTVAQQQEWYRFANFYTTSQKKEKSRTLSGYNLFVKYNCIRLAAGLSVLSAVSFSLNDLPDITFSIKTRTVPEFVAGSGVVNTLSYSNDGVNWVGLGNSFFTGLCYDVFYNGYFYVAAGTGDRTLGYSEDGINWYDVIYSPFASYGYCVYFANDLWLAGGNGSHTQAYSLDGLDYVGLGNYVFSAQCNSYAYNGSRWVAVGGTSNTIGYSDNGTTWNGLGNSIFPNLGRDVCYGNNMFIAVGEGTNTMAYSYDGTTWYGLGASVISISSYGVAYGNGMFVAAGRGTNQIAYSYDGINWVGCGNTFFNYSGTRVSFDGEYFYVSGYGVDFLYKSKDGINWTVVNTGLSISYLWKVLPRIRPALTPPVYPAVRVNFDYNLYDNDYFVLFKISQPVSSSRGYNSNLLKVIVLPYQSASWFDIGQLYYESFHRLLAPGDYVFVEYTIFNVNTGQVIAAVPQKVLVESL